MGLLRWVLLLPGAILIGVVGSLAGSIAATFFGQAAVDTAAAFGGTFAFVFAAGLIAPSHRQRIGVAAAALVAILALGSFLLSVFTIVEAFSHLSPRERVLTPVAQCLGALYALFIFPPLVTRGTTLDRLWHEIVALGSLVVIFGAVIAVAGGIVGLLGRGWLGLGVGLGVLLLGAFTWLFPFMQVTLRMKKAGVVMEGQDLAASRKDRP